MGFASFLELFEASTPVPTDSGRVWHITPTQGGKWIAWNEAELNALHTFASREEAWRFIAPSAEQPALAITGNHFARD
jgi:hypothetical protein